MKVFIPIKKNSQRVKEKNFRNFLDEPLYKYTLLKLKDYEVFVDTDSKEILYEIKNDNRLSHVTGYMRSNNLIGDKISVCSLIENWIKKYGIEDMVCQLHVTSPFLKIETLSKSFEKVEKDFDSVVACNKIQSRLWRMENYGLCPINHNPAKLEQTQDLPAVYEENSLFYIFNSENFLTTGNRIGSNPYFYECSFPENIDIDIEDDWDIALALSKVSI